jgi:RNA polymerase sigma-32 factor
VDESEVVDMDLRLSRSDQSMNAPIRRDEGDGAEFGDFVIGALPSAEENVADRELRRVFMERVGDFRETLGERDRQVLEERILADEPKTLAELGEEFDVSRERVRQLEARIMKRLRDYMQQELVDFDFYATPKDD